MTGGASAKGKLAVSAAGVLVLVLALAGYLWSEQAKPDPSKRALAPTFSLVDLQGRTLALRDLRGKAVLLDFWATWCGPCRDEIPRLVELQAQYAGRGLQIVGISMDDDAEPVRAFYDKYKMNYPVAVGDAALGDLFGGVLGMPVKFLVDRAGRIVSRRSGAVDLNEIEQELQLLLDE